MSDFGIVRLHGDNLDDLETVRIAVTNRIKAFEDLRGEAMPHLYHVLEPILESEERAIAEIKSAWHVHPLSNWTDGIPGLKEGKLIARLLAVTGEPSLRPVGHFVELDSGRRAFVVDEYVERTAGQFRTYCGHGDPARAGHPPKGATQEELFRRGNPVAKKRAYLIGAQFVKTPASPYRDVYLEWRERYEGQTHEKPCLPCGPSGHPAPAGSLWSAKHQDRAARRNTTKEFLIDLWVESRRQRGLSVTHKRGKRGGVKHRKEA